jgi:glycosyltransferase involved in cell wall biosynthesis
MPAVGKTSEARAGAGLRVLHVIPSFAGGGAERQLAMLAHPLVRRGVDVHIAHVHDGPNLSLATSSGATLHMLGVRRNHDPRTLTRLIALIRHVQPDVVQTWLLHADVFGGTAARLCGVPWVLSERCSGPMYEHGLKFRLRKWLGRGATAVVANSERGVTYWRSAGFAGPAQVIRNIVVVPAHVERQAGASATEGDLILGIGRLSEQKNWTGFLAALEAVFAERARLRAVVLGEGPLQGALQARIDASPALQGRVQLAGYADDVGEWLRRASMLVSLSHYEGTPNAVLEAMAARCPVVVSDIAEHREIADAASALFAPLDAPATAAQAIERVLADPAGAEQRAHSARQRVEGLSGASAADQYVQLYRSLAKRALPELRSVS